MRVNLMPLFAWYLLVVAAMILFAFPPLIAGDILFELQRMFDWPFFDPERGGDPILWQHLFWIFGHPEVYIIFLPSIALLAMIVPTFARTPIVGYSWIVLAAVGTGFLSFGLWVHHMFATGLPQISLAFFSAASEAVAIPTGVQIFAFLATMLAGRVVFSTPMLFGIGGVAVFVIGGLTGVMVALAPFDWQAHDSYFIVAHLHYVLIGGMLFPLVAGLYYYFPLIGGRKLSDRLGRIAFWLMFAGINLAFFPMHVSGLAGMPRRVFTYPEASGWGALNLASTLGAFVLAAGILVVVADVLRPKRRQPAAGINPWNAGTLEWVSDPEENWGVRSVPLVQSRYPLWEQPSLRAEIEAGRWYLPDAEEGWREGLITSVLDAEPEQCQRIAGNSWLPMLSAAALGAVFVGLTFHWWLFSLAFAGVTLALIVALALDRHGAHPREAGEAGRPRPDPAALRLRAGLGRLVGHVHHHGRGRDRVRQPRLLLLLLLDDPRRLHRRPAGSRRRLADGRPGALRRRLGGDARRPPPQRPRRHRRHAPRARGEPGPGVPGRRRRLPRSLDRRHGPGEPRLSGDRLDAGRLDPGPCRGRGDHAGLLPRPEPCRPADAASTTSTCTTSSSTGISCS